MREPPTYRLELERILKLSNGKEMLTAKEVYALTGKGRKWCEKHLTIGKAGISVTKLAWQLSSL